MNKTAFWILLSISSFASANTCPTAFVKNQNGFWISDQAPGWRAVEKTSGKTQINIHEFGGIVYSSEQKKIACVFRTTQGAWITLLSRAHKNFHITQHTLAHSENVAWRSDKKHLNFFCGRPTVTQPEQCEFTVDG